MRASVHRIAVRRSARPARRRGRAACVALAAGAGALLIPLAHGAWGAGQGPPLAQLSRLAGGPPERCAFAGPDRFVCSWRVQGRLIQGDPGEPTGAVRRANLVCEVPLADDLDRESVCRVHASEDADAVRALPAVSARGGAAAPASDGALHLTGVRTVAAISHFVGDVPQRCRTGAGDQECAWLLLPGGLGHQRLAARSLPAGAVALRCRLPLDGSPRATGSCTLDAPLDGDA